MIKRWLVWILLILRVLFVGLSGFVVFYSLPQPVMATDFVQNDDDEDDDDECEDETNKCESCEGTPEPRLSFTGRLTIKDKPMWYDSAKGPDFEMFMEYTPQLRRSVRGDIGRHWSCSYFSYELQEKSLNEYWFHYGNGKANRFVLEDGSWKAELAKVGTEILGTAEAGQGLWRSADSNTVVVSDLSGQHYTFNRRDNGFRLEWIGNRRGERLVFGYAGDADQTMDYAQTADGRRFLFDYYTNYTHAPHTAINSKLKSVTGPYLPNGEGWVEIPEITREITLSYEVTDSTNVLLAGVTDMGGRHYAYTYVYTNFNVSGNARWMPMVQTVTGPGGEMTTVDYQMSPSQVTIFFPDDTWERVRYEAGRVDYTVNYWTSDQGSAANPVRSTRYTFNRTQYMWLRDNVYGQRSEDGTGYIVKRFDQYGTLGTNARPYLARKPYQEIVYDIDSSDVLLVRKFSYVSDTNQIGLSQADVTDPYQRWGHTYKIEEYDGEGQLLRSVCYDDLHVDDAGAVVSKTTVRNNYDNQPVSEMAVHYEQRSWLPTNVASWPEGFPLTNYWVMTNLAQRINDAQWSEEVRSYDEAGRLISESQLVQRGADEPAQYEMVRCLTYYTNGISCGRLATEWKPFTEALKPSVATNPAPSGVRKRTAAYDEAGRVIMESRSVSAGMLGAPYETVTNSYDLLNRPVKRVFNDGTIEAGAYGCCGLIQFTDRDGNVTRYDRDARQRAVRIVQRSASGTVVNDTSYEYDAEGNVVLEQNALGAQVQRVYDSNGNITQVIGPLGQITRYTYDGQGRRIYSVAPNGRVERIFRDDSSGISQRATYVNGQDAAITNLDASLSATSPMLDANGNPMITTYRNEGLVRYLYPPAAHDGTAPFSYENSNWLIRVQLSLAGNVTNETIQADGVKSCTTKVYSPNGLLLTQVGPYEEGSMPSGASGTVDYLYGYSDNQLFSVRPVSYMGTNTGQRTRPVYARAYDGRFALVTNRAVGTMSVDGSLTVTNLQQLAMTTVEAVEYDDRERTIAQVKYGQTNLTSYTRRSDRLLEQVDTAGGETTIRRFDANRLVYYEKGTHVREYDYDVLGNLTNTIFGSTAGGQPDLKVSQSFDALNRVVQETDACGDSTWMDYNFEGKIQHITFPDGGEQYQHHDVLGNLIRKYGANVLPVEYAYNAAGQKVTLTDGEGAQTRWQYDPQGRLTHQYSGTNAQPDFALTYDLHGRRIQEQLRDGSSIRYWFDGAGMLRGIDYADPAQAASLDGFLSSGIEGADVRYAYDVLGRVIQLEDSSGVTTYAYDGASDRVVREEKNGWAVARTYDAGALMAVSVSHNGVTNSSVDYQFTNGMMKSLVCDDLSVGYEYDPRKPWITQKSVMCSASEVCSESRSYNDCGMLVGVTNRGGGAVISSFGYSVDSMGRRETRERNDGSQDIYGYDDAGQLVSAVNSSNGSHYGYSYDAAGNRTLDRIGSLSLQRSFNAEHVMTNILMHGLLEYQGAVTARFGRTLSGVWADGVLVTDGVTDVTWESVEYARGTNAAVTVVAEDSALDKQAATITKDLSETYIYNANGQLLQNREFGYSWNAAGLLATVAPIVTNDGAVRLSFNYDGLGRRVERVEESWGGGIWTQVCRSIFIYDQWRPLVEIRYLEASTGTNWYLWGADAGGQLNSAGGIGGLVAARLDDEYVFYQYDGGGNVVQLADTNGIVVGRYSYDPYGRMLTLDGAVAQQNRFRYATKYHDWEVGLLYFGYRYYGEQIGQWIKRDPLAQVKWRERQFNMEQVLKVARCPYNYVNNDPINLIDPLGLKREGFYDYEPAPPADPTMNETAAQLQRAMFPFGKMLFPVGKFFFGRTRTCGRVCTRQLYPDKWYGKITQFVGIRHYYIAIGGEAFSFPYGGEDRSKFTWNTLCYPIRISKCDSCSDFADCLRGSQGNDGFNSGWDNAFNNFSATYNCQSAVHHALWKCGGYSFVWF